LYQQSETVEEGVANIREAIEPYIETLVEGGLPIPTKDILIKPIRCGRDAAATHPNATARLTRRDKSKKNREIPHIRRLTLLQGARGGEIGLLRSVP